MIRSILNAKRKPFGGGSERLSGYTKDLSLLRIGNNLIHEHRRNVFIA